MDCEDHPEQCRDTFASAKTGKKGEQMAYDGDNAQSQLIINELRRCLGACHGWTNKVSEICCSPSLQDIDDHYCHTGLRPQHPECIGCPRITAAVLTYVYAIKRLSQPHGGG